MESQNYVEGEKEYGRYLSHPEPGEEVVIAGMAGSFPDADNVNEFAYNLFNKIDMISGDNRRWEPTPDVPHRTGKINHIERFDAGFFGIGKHLSDNMCPLVRFGMERAIDAIFDAGVNPADLEGTNTGVFVGACTSEAENYYLLEKKEKGEFFTGSMRCMIANRISYYLKVNGPSINFDTACSSSAFALDQAYRSMRRGECDQAIVAGCNFTLHPATNYQFFRLGVLSEDGRCKVFDKDGNGYARSESVNAVFLQKSKDARRILAQIVHMKTNCDGFKEISITYPSGPSQMRLLKEVYDEADVDPTLISYVEAHGTGTKVGDPEEFLAIEHVFGTNRKETLLIGSVKSNIGHTEPGSGLNAIIKSLLAFEYGEIPPNLNYNEPREGLTALEEGRFKVVTEKTPFQDNRGLIAVNNFGFGGANAHALIKWNPKLKKFYTYPDDLPRVVAVSARVEAGIHSILDEVAKNYKNVEFIGMIQGIFRNAIPTHLYRGFSIITKSGEIFRSFTDDGNPKPLCLAFSDLEDFKNIGQNMLKIDIFKNVIQEMHNLLAPKGLHILNIILSKQECSIFENIVGSVAVQLGLTQVMKTLNLKPDYFFGVSLGCISMAYFDNTIDLLEAICLGLIIAEHVKNFKDSEYLFTGSEFSAIRTKLTNEIASIFKKPKEFSSKLISKTKQSASAEFFVNNLTRPNLLEDLQSTLPFKSTVFEIGNASLHTVATQATKNYLTYLSTVQTEPDYLLFFVKTIGRLFENGYHTDIEKLYPAIQYPVSRGTPSISSLIRFNHETDVGYPCYKHKTELKAAHKHCMLFTSPDKAWAFVNGHVVDGRNLFPATGYLKIVWETLQEINVVHEEECKITFENVRFMRAVSCYKDTPVDLTVMIQRGSGNFEVIERDQTVVSGRIYISKNIDKEQIEISGAQSNNHDYLPLKTKDIYKELRLRGYNYNGLFRGLIELDPFATKGKIKWTNNWVAFMDNMLQVKILQMDSRFLYVPTTVKKLTISCVKHFSYLEQFGTREEAEVPVFCDPCSGIIKSGGIEIYGLGAASIVRRKLPDPVLEKYVFVPNQARLDLEKSVRVNTQVILENNFELKVKVVELIDEYTKNEDIKSLGPLVHASLTDQPLIQADITVLTKEELELNNVTIVKDKKLHEIAECLIMVGSGLLSRIDIDVFKPLKPHGYVISREPLDLDFGKVNTSNVEILTIHTTDVERLVLYRKKTELKRYTPVNISNKDESFEWVQKLKSSFKVDPNVIVYVENEPMNGILGMVNCLRREPGGVVVKSVFTTEPVPKFDMQHPFYQEQLKKNLAVNVFKNGVWGTYRHLSLPDNQKISVEHCYVNVRVRGDLSSLSWIQGNLTYDTVPNLDRVLVHNYYVSLNFRDVMTATGKLSADVITLYRPEQENVQGFEFCGRTTSGKRVMGAMQAGACSTLIDADSYLLMTVPDNWTMEEAATVPVVYLTVMYAFFSRISIKRGNKILIHAGTGGIGHAAITVALHYGLQVFTTVGTPEKREYIKKKFPQLTDRCIGNSRDTSFEELIKRETKGQGVDIVLNSLAGEKMEASIRCLAKGGAFLEIGKFDLANNNPLRLRFFEQEQEFHGIMLDSLFAETPHVKSLMCSFFEKCMAEGVIKPFEKTVFKSDEVEQAFRYLATGKHVGKVLLQVRKEEADQNAIPKRMFFDAVPRYSCNPDRSYIVAGGLGGFGLELADWLVLRGARKVILTSRTGVRTGYQSLRIRIWNSYGATVHISTKDITTKEGCKELLEEAEELGPLEAIFNLAVVLKDSILENQTIETFKDSYGPKSLATKYLDELTRESYPNLRNFVVFSSVSCGRGNAGQTNYGYSNSVMERICEKRRADGFSGLAIEWGAIGEVGLVAEMQEIDTEIEIGGTLQQKISNCLQVLDTFLLQKEPIVSSIVVAEKKSGSGGADNIVDAVAHILGLKDLKSVSFQATLSELGMDSMTAVEIKQTLEREFEVFLTPQDLRSLTFARLQELQAERDAGNTEKVMKVDPLEHMFRVMGKEETATLPIIQAGPQNVSLEELPKVVFFPGIEGTSEIMENLTTTVSANSIVLQYPYDIYGDTVHSMATVLLKYLEGFLLKSEPFNIVAHSFGVLVALEAVNLLEQKGYKGQLICIDGAPFLLKEWCSLATLDSQDEFEVLMLCHFLSKFVPSEVVEQNKGAFVQCKSFDERITIFEKIAGVQKIHSIEHSKNMALGGFKRMLLTRKYVPSFEKLQSKVSLLRPALKSFHHLPDDYDLSQLVGSNVIVTEYNADHLSIVDVPEVNEYINSILLKEHTYFKESLVNSIEQTTEQVNIS